MTLRFVLLALLSKEPNTGYGLGRLLHRRLNHLWDARLQQIYSEMSRLEALGLAEAQCIDQPNRPAKKVYSLTPAGHEALDEWLAQQPAPISCKDDLLIKLYCLERMPDDIIIRRLEERRDEYEGKVRELRHRLAETRRTDPAELGHLLTLEAVLARAEGQASWCDRALSSVRERDQGTTRFQKQPLQRSRAVRTAGA